MRFSLQAFLALSLCLAAYGHDEVTPKPKLLQKGVPLTALSGTQGSYTMYKVVIPPNVDELTIRTRGGSGDCDLNANFGVYPTHEVFDFSSSERGTNERIDIQNPAEGPWYIAVDGFASYRGVRLTATYKLKTGAVAVPLILPGPGVYAGRATVQLKCSTKGATLRYTTDGSEPAADSPKYTKPFQLQADARVRVKAFNRKGVASPEVEGYYFIHAKEDVIALESTVPRHHLAGGATASHWYKIAVPAGTKSLRVSTEGGRGDVDLYVKAGVPPTRFSFDKRSARKGNHEGIVIEDPAEGDYLILVRGRSSFSGVTLLASARESGVDLIAWQSVMEPYITTECFDQGDCEVQEGMIQPGVHRLLRFSTETRNLGGDDLVMPDPENNPDFEYQDCHGHYHFLGFSSYRLLDSEGEEVALGNKVSFCLLDLERWDPTASRTPKYTCSRQGIQAGWSDVYDSGLPGQWIVITDVPPGTYTLEVTMNPDGILAETDYTNNTATVEVIIPALPPPDISNCGFN